MSDKTPNIRQVIPFGPEALLRDLNRKTVVDTSVRESAEMTFGLARSPSVGPGRDEELTTAGLSGNSIRIMSIIFWGSRNSVAGEPYDNLIRFPPGVTVNSPYIVFPAPHF